MIGYVLKMFPRFSETFILSEILELERRGRAIHVLSLRKPDDGRFHEKLARVRAGVDYLPEHLRCVPTRFLRAHARVARRAPRAYLRALALAFAHLPQSWKAVLRAPLVAEQALARGCRRLHAHFASLPAVTAMLAAELSGLPFTFTAHAKDIFLDGRSPRLLRALMHRADRVVTVSDYNVRFLRDLAGPSLPPERIVRVYNGIDLETFRPAGPRREGDTPLLLAVGRLVEKKGFVDLVRACRILGDRGVVFQCEIVGKGPLRAVLEARIASEQLGRHVRLLGPLPGLEVADRLRQASLLVAPCVVARDGNRDGLPTVIPEALASGIPIVATRVTGVPEAVEDGTTGRVVEPGDPVALADAIEALLRDSSSLRRMGAEARRSAEERFDLRRNVALLDAIFDAGPQRDDARVEPLPAARPSRPAAREEAAS